jgi:hypothetical protein
MIQKASLKKGAFLLKNCQNPIDNRVTMCYNLHEFRKEYDYEWIFTGYYH